MDQSPNCLECESIVDDCRTEKIAACLRMSECDQCDSRSYYYPYGRDESRHCVRCGAEWPVYK